MSTERRLPVDLGDYADLVGACLRLWNVRVAEQYPAAGEADLSALGPEALGSMAREAEDLVFREAHGLAREKLMDEAKFETIRRQFERNQRSEGKGED